MALNQFKLSKAQIIISGVAALGAVTGILLFAQQKKNMRMQGEIFALDKEIKALQLHKLKNTRAA